MARSISICFPWTAQTICPLERETLVEDDPDLRAQAERSGGKLVRDVRCRRSYRFQGMGYALLNRLVLGRTMTRNVVENKEGRMRAVYQNLRGSGLLE